MSQSLPKHFPLEPLEPRRMFAFSQYGQLINQELAVTNSPNITGKGQTIAVIDTGINYNLAELGAGFGPGFKVVGGHDFASNDDDPRDEAGHGTAVAWCVAGNAFTSGGLTHQGIAPEANLVALRVGDGSFPWENIQNALKWVIDHRVEFNITVVNMSLGSGNFSEVTLSPVSAELKQLAQLGVFVAVASGNSNDGEDPPIHQDGLGIPAADPYSFAVGAIDANDVLADFGQRGIELDLLAPGVDIITPRLNGGFAPIDGTSFASPMVAGAAALIKQLDPSALPNDIGSILMTSGITNFDGDDEVGGTSSLVFSRLDVNAAINLARQRVGRTGVANFGTTFDTAVDAQHILHAAWYDAANTRVLYATQDQTGKWSNAYIVDDDGDVGANLSIAIAPTGQVGIAYFDSVNTSVKYASLSGDPEAGWTIEIIESAKHVGLSPSLDYDHQSNAYVAYYRRTSGDLKLATRDRATGNWTRETLDGLDGADVGGEADLDVGEALFHIPDGFTQFDTTIAIAYTDATNGNLKYARRNLDDVDDTWFVSTVDDRSGVGSIDLHLHTGTNQTALQAQIAYQDQITADVRYAFRNVDWFTESVATTGRLGDSVQMYFEGNTPLIVYSDHNQGNLFIAARRGTNSWTSRRSSASSDPQSVTSNDRTHSVFFSWLNPDATEVRDGSHQFKTPLARSAFEHLQVRA
jgi:hypothetical protein